MKRLFSNPRFLHTFYLCIMALLWYVAWYIFPNPSTQAVLSDAKIQLFESNENNESLCKHLQYEIKEQTNAYRNRFHLMIQQKTDSVILLSESLLEKVIQNKKNITPTSVTMMKNDVSQYDSIITTFIEERDYKDVFQNSKLKKTIANQDFWQNLINFNDKEQQLQVEILKNMILNEELNLLDFFVKKSGVSYRESWGHIVAISPNMGVIRVGEAFKADAFFSAFINRADDLFSININGIDFPMREGVAHFEKRYYKIGKHTITVTGSIKNPFTNQVESKTKEFSFEVLPKAETVSNK